MDPHSELELKYYYTGVYSALMYQEFFHALVPKATKFEQFKIVCGTDTYFSIPNSKNAVRFRKDMDGKLELTYKERKTDKSIVDRVEINIPLSKENLTENSVHVFLKFLGCKKEFTLHKKSYIYHLIDDKCVVVLALYDVRMNKSRENKTFIEIEIDSKSKCSKKMALKTLKKWGKIIQNNFPSVDGAPINKSLYEIYKEENEC